MSESTRHKIIKKNKHKNYLSTYGGDEEHCNDSSNNKQIQNQSNSLNILKHHETSPNYNNLFPFNTTVQQSKSPSHLCQSHSHPKPLALKNQVSKVHNSSSLP